MKIYLSWYYKIFKKHTFIDRDPYIVRHLIDKTDKSSHPEVFCKKSVLKNFGKFTGKHLCQRFWYRCFPVSFAIFLRTPFFIKHLRWLLLNKFIISCHCDKSTLAFYRCRDFLSNQDLTHKLSKHTHLSKKEKRKRRRKKGSEVAFQRFLGKGVLKICSEITGAHPCRSMISIQLLCTAI